MGRIEREKATVKAMIRLYCRGLHRPPRGALCPDCAELLEYALKRLAECALGESKPVCVACAVHCYRPELRGRIRTVMRWAGPRMILRHPYLALRHFADSP